MKRRHTIEAQNQRLWLTLQRLLMEEKNKPETARKGTKMKLEDIKTKTKDAVD
jgi:hypothetical protein